MQIDVFYLSTLLLDPLAPHWKAHIFIDFEWLDVFVLQLEALGSHQRILEWGPPEQTTQTNIYKRLWGSLKCVFVIRSPRFCGMPYRPTLIHLGTVWLCQITQSHCINTRVDRFIYELTINSLTITQKIIQLTTTYGACFRIHLPECTSEWADERESER